MKGRRVVGSVDGGGMVGGGCCCSICVLFLLYGETTFRLCIRCTLIDFNFNSCAVFDRWPWDRNKKAELTMSRDQKQLYWLKRIVGWSLHFFSCLCLCIFCVPYRRRGREPTRADREIVTRWRGGFLATMAL